jgi:diacylglycerol O-acyltransferase / wax synthase
MSKIKLNNVDLAWLHMEKATNPMAISVVLQFKGQLNYDRLVTTIRDTFGHYRRFRQRIVRPGQIFSRPYWEDDPDYRVEDHIQHLDLQFPADDAVLEEFINKNLNMTLDFAHPLWKVIVVDNHADGSILIARVHHCIADGISLMRVLLQMTKASSEEPANQASEDNSNQQETQANRESANTQTTLQAFDRSEISPTDSITKPGETISNHNRSDLSKNPAFTEIIAAMTRIIFRSPDPSTMLKGQLGKIKKAVWSEPFSLPEIKKIAKYKHATTNDVLMAIATGAIRRYIELHNDNRKGNIRAFILVNMRGHSLDYELGNKFGIVFLTLPVEGEQPLERLDKIKQNMDGLKASSEYAATYLILNILGLMPEWIENQAIKIFDSKGTVVATNVPGPRRPIYLAGAPIISIKAWVPQSGRIGVGLSFISYNNQVVVGLNVDAGLIPDSEKFIKLFTEEFQSFQAVLPAVTFD